VAEHVAEHLVSVRVSCPAAAPAASQPVPLVLSADWKAACATLKTNALELGLSSGPAVELCVYQLIDDGLGGCSRHVIDGQAVVRVSRGSAATTTTVAAAARLAVRVVPMAVPDRTRHRL
jgi:hypothetical protein